MSLTSWALFLGLFALTVVAAAAFGVRLPFYGAFTTLTREGKKYEQGLYWVLPPKSVNPKGTAMVGNRGLGMTGIAPRVRFLARPEVGVIDLIGR